MKKLLFYTVIYCLFSLSLAAQDNSLKGKILFLNSDKTPAIGVEISGSIKIDSITINANPAYTANDGSYNLVFPNAVTGHVVELKISDKDGSGQAIEIVNEEELRICRIPEDPAEEFQIIVCKKGDRDVAAKKYYNTLKTSSGRELDRMKKQWSALVDQKEKDYEKITGMSKRIDGLQKQSDSLKLYKEALRIASINKDNATKRVLKYLKLLDEGTSIKEARKELSIKNAIDELETRAGASKSIFDYKDAIKCYDTIISYAEKIGVDQLKIAGYCAELAFIFFDDGKYTSALKYQRKIIDVLEESLNTKHPDLAVAYTNIAVTYSILGQYKIALEYHQKAVAIQEKILRPKHLYLATSYNNISNTYRDLGQYERALKYLQKSIDIRELHTDFCHPCLAASYNNIGLAYAKNKQFKEAQAAFSAYEKLFPKKGQTYRNWAMYYALQNDKEKALSNLQKAVELGYNNMEWLKTDDSVDSLRAEKAFMEIIKKLETSEKR